MAASLLLLALLCGGSGHLSLTGPWPLSSPAQARRPLAQPGCAEGPLFWCRSLATAVQCGAVQICAQTGWNQAAKEDMCADCQQIVTILTHMAKESAFKDAIQKFLTHECTTLPLSSLVPHCQKLVDTYFSLFVACLEGQIKTASICAKLGLCPTDPMQDQDPEPPASLSPEKWILPLLQGLRLDQGGPGEDLPFPLPMCWMCRSFVGRIQATIPKEAIAKSMSQLCRLLPGTIGGMCQCLMEKYTITVLDLLLGRLGPRLICGMLFLCATGENCGPELPPVPLLDQSTECQACVAVTGLAKSTVRANSSAADVEAALLGACSGAPPDWQECKSFIERHRPRLLLLLPKAWDPQSTCQELGACGAGPGPAPGAEGCVLGPAYWCSSPEAAKQCQAMQHCQAHGWA
ncbi:pulmonary surfactant-associated protein B [Emydura macquarii macquarii]|uniref:pulmonary surfactant-associated protein B n=1 Tax=Emydura macquarii macquarii TaxID=1129001 RepID=UPI00352A0BA4